jgi:hypothetical protein
MIITHTYNHNDETGIDTDYNDVDASYALYDKILKGRILEIYPDADVTISHDINVTLHVDDPELTSEESSDIWDRIEWLRHTVYEEGNFWI